MKRGSPYDVIIIGGGLAGLAAAILLAKQSLHVVVIEKNAYPFHRVCGEYISNESWPFLEMLGIPLSEMNLPKIRKLRLTTKGTKPLDAPLELGGFGLSRYELDAMLASQAKAVGVQVMDGTRVQDVRWQNDGFFEVSLLNAVIHARLVLGAFGKRSNVDIKMQRPFVAEKPGKLNNYIAVKYHIQCTEPDDAIALHLFKGGYAGVSRIEDGQHCLCYLTTAHNLGLSNNSIEQMEQTILAENPYLRELLTYARKNWTEPLSISQISFAEKSQVENHILMLGDAAGLITPLCGNGMSMALHAGSLAAAQAAPFLQGAISRHEMEVRYKSAWRKEFASRLRAGRALQSVFGDPFLSKGLILAGRNLPMLAKWIIGQTHGKDFT